MINRINLAVPAASTLSVVPRPLGSVEIIFRGANSTNRGVILSFDGFVLNQEAFKYRPQNSSQPVLGGFEREPLSRDECDEIFKNEGTRDAKLRELSTQLAESM